MQAKDRDVGIKKWLDHDSYDIQTYSIQYLENV